MRTLKTRKLRCEPLEDRRMLSITLFVDDSSTAATPDGLDWGTAYDDLQSALAQAATRNDVDAIWIAEGTYTPTAKLEPGDARSASFNLVDGVNLYGGFAGTEITLAARDLSAAHTTTLSGDLGTLGDKSDNAYTVVNCCCYAETEINGFVITGGNANVYNRDVLGMHKGGGIFNARSPLNVGHLIVSNCVISGNFAEHGGGVSSEGYITIKDSTIVDNQASMNGGGIGISCEGFITLEIVNVTISGNSAPIGGGIGYVTDLGYLDLTITNSTISGNSANTAGGMVIGGRDLGSSSTINNTIIAGNFGSSDLSTFSSSACDLIGSNNLIGIGDDQTLVDGVDGNQVGTSSLPIDPMLAVCRTWFDGVGDFVGCGRKNG